MPSDTPVVLAIDTSAAQCAAALLSGGRVVGARAETMARGQAERLLPMCVELLAEAGLDWPAVGRLAVCTGPGNFTGLRVGIAAARGLALGLGVRATGVTRFAALAAGYGGVTLVTLEAPGGRIWWQTLRAGRALGEPGTAEALDAIPAPAPGASCLGFCAGALAAHLGLAAGSERVAADPADVARIAVGAPDAPRPVPLYLRPPDAVPARAPA